MRKNKALLNCHKKIAIISAKYSDQSLVNNTHGIVKLSDFDREQVVRLAPIYTKIGQTKKFMI